MGIILIEMFRNIMGAGHWTELTVPGRDITTYNSAKRDDGGRHFMQHYVMFNPSFA